jgi:hypothetical protein
MGKHPVPGHPVPVFHDPSHHGETEFQAYGVKKTGILFPGNVKNPAGLNQGLYVPEEFALISAAPFVFVNYFFPVPIEEPDNGTYGKKIGKIPGFRLIQLRLALQGEGENQGSQKQSRGNDD